MHLRMTTVFVSVPLIVTTLASCTGIKDPQLAMCQALAKEMSGMGVSSWDKNTQRETDRMRTVSLRFTTDSNKQGSIVCDYPREENGNTATAPESVTFNGQRVDRKTLLVQGGRVTNNMLTEAAELTALKIEDAARDAAEGAVNTAKDAAQSLQQ